jgi:hypothetical protein
MTPQTIDIDAGQFIVNTKDERVIVCLQTAENTQLVYLTADQAIDLYAALDVAIDRAREAELPVKSAKERADDLWHHRKEMEDADRGL